MAARSRSPSNGIMGMAFKATLGGLAGMVVYLFVGMLFLVPGMILIFREQKKTSEKRNKTLLIVGIVLAILGAIISLGMGFGVVMDGIGTLLD